MVNHRNKHVVREWYWQRLSAIVLALLLPISFFLLLCLRADAMNYMQFIQFLHQMPVQIWHSLMLMAFCLHVWLGFKVILEDYMSIGIRIPTLAFISIVLITIMLWGMKIIWWVQV